MEGAPEEAVRALKDSSLHDVIEDKAPAPPSTEVPDTAEAEQIDREPAGASPEGEGAKSSRDQAPAKSTEPSGQAGKKEGEGGGPRRRRRRRRRGRGGGGKPENKSS